MEKMILARVIFLLAALLAAPAAVQAQFSYKTNADGSIYTYNKNADGSINIAAYAGPPWAVTIPTNLNGQPVTSLGSGAFAGLTDLTGIAIPGSITNIGDSVFAYCSSLTNAGMANGLLSIGEDAFESCASLSSVTIPSTVTNLGEGSFIYCTGLTNLTILNGVTGIGDEAFAGCSSLASVTIPASVTNMGAPFGAILNMTAPGVLAWCASLTEINVDPENEFYSSVNGVLFDKSASTLLQYPGGISGGYAIPGSVTSIGPEAFCGTALTSVTIPAGVANFGYYAFAFCASLTNVTMANGVTGFGGRALYEFQGCTNLASITIPGSVGSIGADAFSLCSSLTSATIGDGVTNIGEFGFAYCTLLASITIPSSMTSIGGYAFAGTSLSSIYFKGNALPVDSSAFRFDTNVTIYYLPGATGWSNSFANLPAVLWNPLIQTGDGSFGVQNGQFGFNITGATNIPIVVEACTNLAGPVWTPLQSLTLTNGGYYFSEPIQPGSSGRYYRIGSQ